VRPEARFGAHSRASLVASVERVAARLGIRDPCPVYLVRDKEINAAAMPLSLLPGVGRFAAIHLNRAVLHLLDEAELESVIGHEFGHVYRYADLTGRYLLVHAAFAAALTTVLGEFLAGSELRYGAPLMALIPARWLAFSSTASRSREVEFLCDDCGAIAAGTRPAMRAKVKLALEAEVRGELMDRVLEALLEGHDVPVDKLLAAYDAALPFGAVAPDEARSAIQGGIDRLRRGHGELSLAGFWQFMFARADVDEDAVRDQLARGQAVRDVELVSVGPRDVLLGHASLERCVAAIETESPPGARACRRRDRRPDAVAPQLLPAVAVSLAVARGAGGRRRRRGHERGPDPRPTLLPRWRRDDAGLGGATVIGLRTGSERHSNGFSACDSRYFQSAALSLSSGTAIVLPSARRDGDPVGGVRLARERRPPERAGDHANYGRQIRNRH